MHTKKRLKIAVYYPWVYLKGGIERSMSALISRSRHDWTIFTSHYDRKNTFEEFENFRVVTIGNVSVKRNMGAVLKAAMSIARLRLPLKDFDAYVVWCDGLGPLTTFRNQKIPAFCICSTPLRPVYDEVYAEEALRSRKPIAKLAYHSFKRAFHAVDRRAWKNFDGVVATSLEVKRRIVENKLFPDNERMVLHYPGIDFHAAPEDVTYEKFLLVPGRISWTKNIPLAVEAFRKANLSAPWKLVIAGFVDRKSERHLAELREAAGDAAVEIIVNPSDATLNSLYQRASAILFTPLNEDWGIAPLEGMSFSKPVLANNQGGPAESVVNGETGWLMPPGDVAAWAKAIKAIADNPKQVKSMGAEARKRVRRYDWAQFSEGVDDLIARRVHARQSSLPLARTVPAASLP